MSFVSVKTLDGRQFDFPTVIGTLIRDVKAAAENHFRGSFKLLAKGQEAKPAEEVSALGLTENDFLVALPIRKRKAPLPASAPLKRQATSTAQDQQRMAGESVPLTEESTKTEYRECTDRQTAQLLSQRRESSCAAAEEASRRENGAPVSPQAETLSPVQEGSTMYTLLPGYVSRPNPSPNKATYASRPKNGFVAPLGARSPERGQPCSHLEQLQPGSARENGSVDHLWADLAQELQRAQQRETSNHQQTQALGLQPGCRGLRADPAMKIQAAGAMPDIADPVPQSGDLSEEEPLPQKQDLKAQRTLLAVASKDDPILTSVKPGPVRSRRQTQRRILPGGQDARLTPQGRLSAKEAAAVAGLPLPPSLERLDRVFAALNTVYCFLQLKNIQGTWAILKSAVTTFPGTQDATLDDVQDMALLCPEVVYLQDKRSVDGPRSIKEFNRKVAAWGRRQPGEAEQALQEDADPLHIHGDAASSLPQSDDDYTVLEIVDASRHSVAAIARAMSQPSEPKEALEKLSEEALRLHALAGDGGPESAVEDLRSKPASNAGEGEQSNSDSDDSSEEQRERGLRNVTARRRGAFRRGIVRAVMLMHDRFLAAHFPPQPPDLGPASGLPEGPTSESCQAPEESTKHEGERLETSEEQEVDAAVQGQQKLGPEGSKDRLVTIPVPKRQRKAKTAPAQEGAMDALKEGRWHGNFRIQELTLAEIKEVSARAAQELATAEQQGRVRPSWEGAVGSSAPRPPRMTRKHEPCRDCTHMDVTQFLRHLKGLPWYAGQVAHIEDMPPRSGVFQTTSRPLSQESRSALEAKGITSLFKHQAEAVDAAVAGQHVVVSTSTASGKSLCYNLPIIEALAERSGATAIYIFPTKALAQDQLRALREFMKAAFPTETPIADVYDGDTPQDERAEIRSRAQLLITNPDMLHQSILPVHRQFSALLGNLKYVVVDEGHAYRGVFGCHTALVLRRLRRICEREYSCHPTFVVTSATIANPQQHIKALLGVDEVSVISQDGSPHGPQRFVLWNPPLTAPNHALAVANGVQRSRTEGRARKGERKRAKKAIQAALGASEQGIEVDDTPEANISLAFSAARLHRRRHMAGVLEESYLLPSASQGDSEASSEPASFEEEEDLLEALGALEDPEAEAVAEQERLPSGSDFIAEQRGIQKGGKRRQLTKDEVMAAMAPKTDRKGKSAVSGQVSQTPDDALAAVVQVANLTKARPRFEPKNIVYRSDEPGSSSNARPLLRRRLHGHRYGQKSGMAHPAGQYAHASRGNDIQSRMPGDWRSEFKDKWGTAGVSLDQRRKSPIVEISMLLAECVQHGVRTIAFCKTRKLCELVITYAREMLRNSAPHLCHAISVYRAGYSPMERREIEKALFDGTLYAVAATNALELGLDVGGLDMTMHLGFQGSVASFRQQAGRAGRREQQSMSIYVAFDGPMDQYFMTYPRQLFDKPIEAAHIDPSNRLLLEQHLTCAASESPIVLAADQYLFGTNLHKAADALVLDGLLGRHPMAQQTHALHYIGRADNPAGEFSLRAIDPDRYQIINEAEGGYVMEEIEESKAFFQVYDGAVYMFQGRTYLCKKLDLASKTAIVRPVDVKYYTSIREHTDIYVVGGSAAYPAPEAVMRQLRGAEEPTMAQCAEAEVTTRWLGYHRVRHGTGEIFDTVDLFLPDVQFPTQAAYLRVPQLAKARLAEAELPYREGLHAAMHAILNVVPLHMMCGVGDLGAECDNPYSARFRPDRLLLFDKHPGGIGLAFKVCDLFGTLMRKAMALIEACPCTGVTGCPGCIQHTDCNQYNAVLHKQAGIVVLQATLEAQDDFRKQLALQLSELDAGRVEAATFVQSVGSRLI